MSGPVFQRQGQIGHLSVSSHILVLDKLWMNFTLQTDASVVAGVFTKNPFLQKLIAKLIATQYSGKNIVEAVTDVFSQAEYEELKNLPTEYDYLNSVIDALKNIYESVQPLQPQSGGKKKTARAKKTPAKKTSKK